MSNHLRLVAATAAICAALAPAAATAQYGGRTFNTTLTARAEVPGPGDRTATGSARVTINPGQRQVCYRLTERGIARPSAAHIHRGRAGVAGPVVLTLRTPNRGTSNGCVRVSRDFARNILNNPRRFYVNIHSPRFPNGAIRGQLSR